MEPNELIELFNPDNAKNLNKEQLEAMANLTIEEIRELAKAYPNTGRGRAYLVLLDKSKKADKQVYPLSTWQNLASLYRAGNKNFVAFSFKSIFTRKKAGLKMEKIQDLTKGQAKAKLKVAAAQEAKDVDNEEKLVDNDSANDQMESIEKTTPSVALDKMNKEELIAEYEERLGTEADPTLTKKQLIEAIKGAE